VAVKFPDASIASGGVGKGEEKKPVKNVVAPPAKCPVKGKIQPPE